MDFQNTSCVHVQAGDPRDCAEALVPVAEWCLSCSTVHASTLVDRQPLEGQESLL